MRPSWSALLALLLLAAAPATALAVATIHDSGHDHGKQVGVLDRRDALRRIAASSRAADRTHRLRIGGESLAVGDYRVRLRATPEGGGAAVTAVLVGRRL